MDWVFEADDKSGRKIHLSKERWEHINHEHPEVAPHIEDIKDALSKPLQIIKPEYDENIRYYYRYFKERQSPYLLVIVKYLNNHGFIITAYFVRDMK